MELQTLPQLEAADERCRQEALVHEKDVPQRFAQLSARSHRELEVANHAPLTEDIR